MVTGCYLQLYTDVRGIQSSNSDHGSLTKLKNFTSHSFYGVLARANTLGAGKKIYTHVVFLSLQFLGEIKLLGLQCQQPLPQITCFLPVEQKAGVCHGPAAKKKRGGGRVRSANGGNEK